MAGLRPRPRLQFAVTTLDLPPCRKTHVEGKFEWMRGFSHYTVRISMVTAAALLGAQRGWLLGEPDFRRLWLIGLVVFSVRWLEMLAVAVFAYQHTGSPLIVALLTMLRMLPMALFGALIGAAAERIERRTTLVMVMLSMLLSSIALAFL